MQFTDFSSMLSICKISAFPIIGLILVMCQILFFPNWTILVSISNIILACIAWKQTIPTENLFLWDPAVSMEIIHSRDVLSCGSSGTKKGVAMLLFLSLRSFCFYRQIQSTVFYCYIVFQQKVVFELFRFVTATNEWHSWYKISSKMVGWKWA